MLLTTKDISSLDQLKKVQLATSLPGIKPVCLVGTKDKEGCENLSVFSSVTHFGSSPLLLGMVTRPDTVERHTLSNIIETGVWTLNHIHQAILHQSHHCSAKYPRKVSEFRKTGLTPDYCMPGFPAPAVLESPVKIGLTLDSIIDIPTNGTKLILGKVAWVNLPETALLTDGSIDFESLGVLGSTALDTYFSVRKYDQLTYARPR